MKNKKRLLIAGAVVLNVVAIVGVSLLPWLDVPDTIWLPAVFGIGPALGAMLAVIVVFGGRGVPWRLAGVTVFFVAAMHLLSAIRLLGWHTDSKAELFESAFLVITLAVTFVMTPVLLAMRLGGITLQWRDRVETAIQPEQFSLRSLLAWVVALAIVLGALMCVPASDPETSTPLAAMLIMTLFCAPPAIINTPAVLWLTLGRGWLVMRILAFVVAGVLAAIFWGPFAMMTGTMWDDLSDLLVGAALNALWPVGSLLLLRFAGLEMVHEKPSMGNTGSTCHPGEMQSR